MASKVGERAAQIVRDAGGQIIGRTRLQKIAFFLEIAGLGDGFHFEYKHYGPYSGELADALNSAEAFGLVKINEQQTNWGGWYSTYTAVGASDSSELRKALVCEAAKVDPVELELAATAAFLKLTGYSDPWKETELRKPEKATGGRLAKAVDVYRKLQSLKTPNSLPEIA